MTESSKQIFPTNEADILATIQKRIDVIEYLSLLSKEDLSFLLDEIEQFQDEVNTEKLKNFFYKTKRFSIEHTWKVEEFDNCEILKQKPQAKLEIEFEKDNTITTFSAELINSKWKVKYKDEGN